MKFKYQYGRVSVNSGVSGDSVELDGVFVDSGVSGSDSGG